VRLVLAALHLSWMGGATTYLLTTAPYLQRLGHDVTLYSPDAGDTAALARERGLRVATSESELPGEVDGVLVQDTVLALELADRFPVPQLFVAHGAEHDLAAPPQLPGVTAAIVVMNDRVARRARALAVDSEVVRLRQPIDIERFNVRGPAREVPERVLLLGNYLRGRRRQLLTDVCEELGLEWRQIGRDGQMVTDPASEIAAADIVVGYGRSALEAMSLGRPTYLFDHVGADGWVTAESYPALEADGFAGTAFPEPADAERVRRDLKAYDGQMGVVNLQLIRGHHSPFEHADQLSLLFKRAAGAQRPAIENGSELARLVRLQWHSDWLGSQLRREIEQADGRALAAEQRAQAAEARMREVSESARWRLVQRAMRPLDALRGRRR